MSVESVIKPIDTASIHKITSGQVVIDLQTAVKELVENSIDAGATSVEVRFKQYGVKGVEVIDNGCGIAEEDYDSIALKHHTSKLASFSDLTTVLTFGFRGEAISSLCSLCSSVVVTTSTCPPLGVSLEFDRHGRIQKRGKVARQRGTTVSLTDIFSSFPVRRKELERNAKREFGKALTLLNAYALVPCCSNKGVRLMVSNQMEKGPKTIQLRTPGTDSNRASVAALWGPKAIEHLVDLDLKFDVEREKLVLKRLSQSAESETHAVPVIVKGLVSKFSVGCGRTGTDRQFFYVNGRPCNLSKVQKAFNEVYRTFNAAQAPFILADFIIPTDSCDINISPDKRTIFLHSEGNLISALKASLEATFELLRSTYAVGGSSQATKAPRIQSLHPEASTPASRTSSQNTSTSQKSPGTNGGSETSTTPTSSITNNISKINRIQFAGRSGGPGGLAPPVTTEQDPAQQNHGSGSTDDPMEIDQENENPHPVSPTSPVLRVGGGGRPNAKEVMLPTATASWNQSPSSLSDEGENSDGPCRKRRKSGVNGATASMEETSSKSKRPDMRGILRNKIASFARTGSHPRQQNVSDTESEDETPISKPAQSGNITDYLPRKNTGAGRRKANEATNRDDDIDGEPGSPNAAAIQGDADEPSGSTHNQQKCTLDSSEIISRPEVIRVSDGGGGDVSLRFDLSAMIEKWFAKSSTAPDAPMATDRPTASLPKVPLEAGVSNTENNTWAVDALARVIDKEDFASMDIIGQFNLGFIVARRRKSGVPTTSQSTSVTGEMDDLFIVDQHAADEKYNFETLQQTTKLESQKLFRPQPLELTAADELLAIENMDVLRQNGFEVEANGDGDNGSGEASRLSLIAQPVSKTTCFDMKDLEEIIHLMRDRPTGQMVRCSKARAMFAMRACRKSFMVGMPLNMKQMASIVQHMGTMDQPWNCPHGRPTMRHLLDLSGNYFERPSRKINWADFR